MRRLKGGEKGLLHVITERVGESSCVSLQVWGDATKSSLRIPESNLASLAPFQRIHVLRRRGSKAYAGYSFSYLGSDK
jgi:hypothetical protein